MSVIPEILLNFLVCSSLTFGLILLLVKIRQVIDKIYLLAT